MQQTETRQMRAGGSCTFDSSDGGPAGTVPGRQPETSAEVDMRGFRLGSIFGFEIRIDYSWFLIFFLILWTFSSGVFPATVPDQGSAVYITMGLVGALLFFSSLVAHELAHSLVARRRGIAVEGITLFIFGGMAHTRSEARSPGDEFVIAGAGPLTSLLIAAVLGLMAWLGAALGWHPAVVGVTRYLAFVNVALAVFNLLPGFPLDGGRLFRAIVWRISGDLHKATRWAATGGRALGYGLMAAGLLEVFMGGLLGGFWLVFIGWFVRTAADLSLAQHLLSQSLEGVRARAVMTPEPEVVAPDASIQKFVDEYILRGRHRAWPVADAGRPVGIVTLEEIRQLPREQWASHSVREVMTPADGALSVGVETPMSDVMDRLVQSPGRRVLVTSDGRLVGIITASDLARWFDRAELLKRVS